MIKNYAIIYFCSFIFACSVIMNSAIALHATDTPLKNRAERRMANNMFQTLEKPIKSVLSVQHFYNRLSTQFYAWHENYFYYWINPQHKKMFLSARILTVSLPLAILGVIIGTSPQVSAYLWNINYTAVTTTPMTVTPASIVGEIGKLSSFNQNCLMIALEKGLRWIIERKIASDVCINPATWFTDQNNHDFINGLTSILLILFLWIYLLYKVYADVATRWKNFGKIIVLQLIIRYALYLANLKNDIYYTSFIEQANYNTNSTPAHIQTTKELQESIEDISASLKHLITITKENQKEQKRLAYALEHAKNNKDR